MRINARDDVGDSGYGVPYNVEEEKIELLEHDVNFIMAIETGGMFDRLIENGFDEDFGCALVHLKGQPARSTRRILKRMSEEWDLPVVVFLDGDPWSFRIFASIAYGAIKTAHISEYLATPTATSSRRSGRSTRCSSTCCANGSPSRSRLPRRTLTPSRLSCPIPDSPIHGGKNRST